MLTSGNEFVRKGLKILGNTFLFDVMQDPMERANLKARHRAVYDRLVAQWHEWNATMLPLDPQSFTLGFTGAELADHFGVKAGARRRPTSRTAVGRDDFAG